MTRRHDQRRLLYITALSLFVFALGSAFGIYLGSGSNLVSVTQSPDRRERIELYTATHWQLIAGPPANFLGYARLSRASDGAVLGTSAPFELSLNGEVLWERDFVQVGSTAVYSRADGSWTIA